MILRRFLGYPSVQTALFAATFTGFSLLVALPAPFRASLTPILAVTGFALGALLLLPRRQWPLLLAIAAAISLTINAVLLKVPWPENVGLVALSVAQVAVQAWLLARWIGLPLKFSRARDVFLFVGVTASVGLITAFAIGALVWQQTGSELLAYTRVRGVNQCLAALTVTPLIITWAPFLIQVNGWRKWPFFEGAALLSLTSGLALFGLKSPSWSDSFLPAPYLTLIPVVILAVRFGMRGATAATFIVTLFVVWAVARGAFVPEGSVESNLTAARLFLGVVATTGLLLGVNIAEIALATKIVQASEERFRTIFHNSIDPLCLLVEDRIDLINPAFLRTFGWTDFSQVVGHPQKRFICADDSVEFDRRVSAFVADGSGNHRLELRGVRANGENFPLEIRLATFELRQARSLLIICRDLTEQRRLDRESKRFNRALHAFGRLNQTLVHAADESDLLANACRVITEDCGHRLAWIGYAQHDAKKSIRPVARYGPASDYVTQLDVTWADEPRGQGPTGTAIRTGRIVACENFQTDPCMAPWHALAAQHGLHSSATFPFHLGGEEFGVLSIYSGDPEGFDQNELRLVAELTDDLAFGIQAQRARHGRERAEAEVRSLLSEAQQTRTALLSILEDRQRAEEAKRLSEERYRSAIENSAIGLAIVSLNGTWLEVNPALCGILGYSRAELLSMNYQSLTVADDKDADRHPVAEMLSKRTAAVEFEKRYRHRSGNVVWVRLNVTLVRDQAGQPLHWVTQTQDITARKHAEASFEAAAERLALALRASKFGVWRHNLQTTESEWDSRMFAIFDLPPTASNPSLELILSRVVATDRERVARSWSTTPDRDRSYQIRFCLQRRDGKIRHIELNGVVHDNQVGIPEWSIGVAGDITDIIEATAESERLRAQLLQSQKMETLGTLAAGVAHDFNNLLTGINGFVDLAAITLSPGHEAADLLKQARRGAMSARDLVRRILNFSRNSKERTLSVIDINDVVRDTAPLITAALPATISLSLSIEIPSALVLGDSGEIQQILMNLCVNGAQAMGGKSGEIRVGVRETHLDTPSEEAIPAGGRAGRHVLLSVTDSGSGMDEATQKRIFEPFFTTKKSGEGTGLGLSIVNDIVAAHGGRLELKSALGTGTTFLVYLPFAEHRKQTVSAQSAPEPDTVRRKRVLVVDDDSSVATVVRFALESHNYSVEVFVSSTAAWHRFEAAPQTFDLLMVDQNMPELSGTIFCERVRRVSPAIPIIVMSGRFENDSILSAQEATRLEKPFDFTELVNAVDAATR